MGMSKTETTLTGFELFTGAMVGVRRHIDCISNNRKTHVVNVLNAWHRNIEGALAELAYAKMAGRYYNFSVNTFTSAPDVGNVDIRYSANDTAHLIVYDIDNDDSPYALIIGEAPTYRFAGWILGRDAKQPDYWRGDVKTPSYWIPQTGLIWDLPVWAT